jgi:hypothetical protein
MSIFLEMAKVIEEELMAGRITVKEAKAQLAINADVAVGLELLKRDLQYRHTASDWERDKYLDETFCCG